MAGTVTKSLLFIAIAVGRLTGECRTTRDVHVLTFVNFATENVVNYITSESSDQGEYSQQTLYGQQLSSLCSRFPDCPKLLYKKYPLENNTIQFVVILPLRIGVSLLDYRYHTSLVLTANRKTIDEGCSATTVIKTGQVVHLICQTADGFLVYEISIDHTAIENSYSILITAGVDVTAANFVYTFEDNQKWICYNYEGNNINCINLNSKANINAGVLSSCSKIDRLELVHGSGLIFWARCDDGSTKSFDVFSLSNSDSISTVSSSGRVPHVCPNPDVRLVVDLTTSVIQYGLESTSKFRSIPLVGSSFRPESGICFEVQGITLLAFFDEEGVYIFNSSALDVRKLSDLQACSSETLICKQLLLFDNRYLHVRNPQGNTLIDTHNNYERIIDSYVQAEFVTVLSLERVEDPDPSAITSYVPDPTPGTDLPSISSMAEPTTTPVKPSMRGEPGGSSNDENLILKIVAPILSTIVLLAVITSLTIYCWRWRKNKKDISVLPEPPFLSIGSPLLQIRPRRPPVGTADENDRAGGQGPLSAETAFGPDPEHDHDREQLNTSQDEPGATNEDSESTHRSTGVGRSVSQEELVSSAAQSSIAQPSSDHPETTAFVPGMQTLSYLSHRDTH